MNSSRFTQIFIVVLAVTATTLNAQGIATFEVPMDPNSTIDIPLSIQLDDITTIPDSSLVLQEMSGSTKVPVPFQISYSLGRRLHWIAKTGDKQKKKTYELARGLAGSTT